jgi:hypothetical protein
MASIRAGEVLCVLEDLGNTLGSREVWGASLSYPHAANCLDYERNRGGALRDRCVGVSWRRNVGVSRRLMPVSRCCEPAPISGKNLPDRELLHIRLDWPLLSNSR